ncbi:MAG: VWA domain-containing protein [Bryobacteraceae bacterium]|nr:VWA domain-containing protein [Bryobacteraceae bacterium]MDW8379042.1 VWA domain-containing protein [Bryobacterales bacterium]
MPLRNNGLLLLLLTARLLGQQEDSPTFTADTRLVVLHASVMDKNGKLLNNLPKEAFRVLENGVEQKIRDFKREDIAVSMGLIIDNSGSMRDKRLKVEAAAMALVKASNPNDEIMIVNFNDDAFLDVPFTNDQKKLEEGLARIDSRGGTAMRDALSMSIDEVKEKGKRNKKVLLVITDGNDNTSQVTLEKLIEKAHRAEVLIYCIGLLSEEERREAMKAKKALTAIANASGGLAFFPKDLAEVEKIALDVAYEIRNQFMIAYTPTNQTMDGSFRQIKVLVNAPGKPTVRTRSGYYATPLPKGPASPSSAASRNVANSFRQ